VRLVESERPTRHKKMRNVRLMRCLQESSSPFAVIDAALCLPITDGTKWSPLVHLIVRIVCDRAAPRGIFYFRQEQPWEARQMQAANPFAKEETLNIIESRPHKARIPDTVRAVCIRPDPKVGAR
jgi:hypothetical protein